MSFAPFLDSFPQYQGKPRNLVIVLEEGLGARFICSLGGRPLSPSYDRLSRQGWAFERLYATGTRSVRGIEAVLTGFPPTPAESVVKLPASRQRFFTLADVLGRHGYGTGFYYGGESHFDNMREFFLANGFTRIVDRKDYRKPAFVGSWGASDEDLFGRADQQFRHMHWASSSARRWPHRTGTTPCSWWWLTMIRGCSAGTWCRSATSIFPG